MIDFDLIWESVPALLHGALMSLLIASIATIIGVSLGTVIGFAENVKVKIVHMLTTAYVTLFRGTPMLVQILFVYYVLPQFGVTIAPFWSASLAIGLNSAAYISQVVRSGINAVPKGQVEAAHTLGFGPFTTIRLIVFPQALRVSLPSLGNELVTLIKDSSLASIIGVMELSKEASIIRSRTYDAFSILLAVALIYLALTATASFFMKKFERALKVDV
ncbi:MAG: amino acid ABC transporter permease [Chlamydiales bacterium]|nr:amino acid ABC transporter permease [Chlamydiales bacterium]